MKEIIAIDSNCYTYLVDVMFEAIEPTCSVAIEKISMLKLYLYTDAVFMTSDAVKQEYLQISDITRKEQHASLNDVLVDSFCNLSDKRIAERIKQLKVHHTGIMDCRVLVEAELGEADYLLTYDKNFMKHLTDKAEKVIVTKPSDLLASKAITPDSTPYIVPHSSNPLSNVEFWRI